MKAKVNLDFGAIKRWLFDHGEKLAFGVVVLVFLLFTWYAIKRETLDAGKQPDVLKQKAASVRAHVEQSQWDPKSVGVEVIDYVSKAKREPLVAAKFKLDRPLHIPIVDQKAKRDDPQIFGVEELRVASGYSIFSLGKAGDKERSNATEAHRWVVVTGLVPVKKQREEFARVLANTMGEDPKRDTPTYLGVLLERAEIDPKDPKKLEWKRVARDERRKTWEIDGDIVAKEFIDPSLTDRLGALAGGAVWDESVAHPKAALVETDDAKTADKPAEPPAEEKKPDAPEGDDVFQAARGTNKAAAAAAAPAQIKKEIDPAQIPYKLLRIFDYTVQENKQYCYRVSLGLANPNYLVSPGFLKEPGKERKSYVQSPTSEPTPAISTPNGSRVFAAGTGKRSRPEDPTAKVVVSRINPDEGMEVPAEMEVRRGSVANFAAANHRVPVPGGGVKELPNVNIQTDMLVVDIHGGQPLGSKRNAPLSPVEVLVLDPSGNLSIHDELAELHQVATRRTPAEPEKSKDEDDALRDKDRDKDRKSKGKGKDDDKGSDKGDEKDSKSKARSRRP